MVINQTHSLSADVIPDFITEDSIIYVTSTWCGPCKVLGPVIDEIAREIDPGIKVGKIVVDESDENGEWAAQLGIRSVPTLIFYQFGNLIYKTIGTKSKQEILDLVTKNFSL